MPAPPNQRVFRSSKLAESALLLSDSRAVLAGSRKNFIVVDNRGITIKGALSFVVPSQEIRRGGLWVELPDFARMIPSTIVTPLPAQIIAPPVVGVQNLKDTVLVMSSLIPV